MVAPLAYAAVGPALVGPVTTGETTAAHTFVPAHKIPPLIDCKPLEIRALREMVRVSTEAARLYCCRQSVLH